MENRVLFAIAVTAVIVSMTGSFITYYTINEFKHTWVTGFLSSSGTANVTLTAAASINFTTNNINWGSGYVTPGTSAAVLDSANNLTTNGTGFTSVWQGLVVENIGNVNVSIDLKTGKDADTLIGGTSPQYQYNVTNAEAGSCTNQTGFNLGAYYNVNTTDPGTRVCSVFKYDTTDTFRIDLRMVIPDNAATGARGDTITATFAQV